MVAVMVVVGCGSERQRHSRGVLVRGEDEESLVVSLMLAWREDN